MFLLGLAIGVIVGMFLGIVLVALLKANDKKEVYIIKLMKNGLMKNEKQL